MNFLKKNIINIIGVLVAFSAIWIIYTAFIVIPREELANKLEIQAREELALAFDKIDRENKYEDCKSTAYREYILDWESACELAGKESDCSLKRTTSSNLDDRLKEKQDTCLTIYKAN